MPDTPHDDMQMAIKTYDGFIGLVKWGTLMAILVVSLVLVLIS